ncbi:tail fiber protein [Leifsonia lichenia]
MSQPYVGEIRMFGGNFAPYGWAYCDGSSLAISEYDTLFQLIGTTYGGDGQTTFALPNLGSRIPLHRNSAPGAARAAVVGETGGSETVTLTSQQLPQHTHPISAAASATTTAAAGNVVAGWADAPYSSATPTAQLAPMLGAVGGSQPHDNLQPYLAVTFIISLFGVFPSQN